MSGTNGKVLRFRNNPMGEDTTVPAPNASQQSPFAKIGLAMNPFSPVHLTGEDALYGWMRLGLYGTLTYLTWSKARKLSYAFGAATAVSLASSLSGKAWNNAKTPIA